MDATRFTKMLTDKNIIDLKKMQYKYSSSEVSEFVSILKQHFYKPLPIPDFNGNPLVYLESHVQVEMKTSKILLGKRPDNVNYGFKAMADEIQASLAIENIPSTRDSIRRMLKGYAPENQSESRLYGMKKGLDFISNLDNQITEENIRKLYMMTVGDFLENENRLLDGNFYRHDAVYLIGDKIEHTGLSAERLPEYMRRFVQFIQVEDTMNDLLKAVVIHFYIGYLHPYFDGNGRMARLIHLWYLVQQGYTSTLFIPFSNHIEASKKKYYQAYTLSEENAQISGVLDLTPFLGYFINQVYHQLTSAAAAKKDTMASFEQALVDGVVTEKEKALFNFVLVAYGEAEFSTKQLEKDFGQAAYATIRSFVLKFTEIGLLTERKYGNRKKYKLQ